MGHNRCISPMNLVADARLPASTLKGDAACPASARNYLPRTSSLAVTLLLLVLAAAHPVFAQNPHIGEPGSPSAKQIADEAMRNEIDIIRYQPPLLRYRQHIVDAKGNIVRDIVESKDGAVARLIYRDNHVLSAEEDATERTRLQNLLNSPNAFAKHLKNDQSTKKIAIDLLLQFAPAMLCSFTPDQPQRPNLQGEPEIIVDFTPDPKWNPPSMASEALTGLRGRIWIDPRTHRMTHMEGDIFQQVNFGWGIFAHVYPGGKLTFDQINIAEQRWIFSHFTENVVFRAILVKTFRETSDVTASNFVQIPPIPWQDAIKLLLDTPLPKN